MKILAVADQESKYLWDYYSPDKLHDADLILACGDLSRQYVTFLATMAKVPLFFVHGNHDDAYDTAMPCGGLCLDDEVVCYQGVRFAGLGGSVRYREGTWQFTEAEMNKRIKKLRSKIDKAGGLDVLVTHAPLRDHGDLDDLPHRGFMAFEKLLDEYHPAVLVHGHVHLNYAPDIPREQLYGTTRLINACERCNFEVTAPEKPASDRTKSVQNNFWERWRGRA